MAGLAFTGTWCQEAVPDLSGATSSQTSQEPGGWRMAESLAAGAESGWQMDGVETVTIRGLPGSVPEALCSLLPGLSVTITAAAGPHQLQERAFGKHCPRVKFSSRDSLCQATL